MDVKMVLPKIFAKRHANNVVSFVTHEGQSRPDRLQSNPKLYLVENKEEKEKDLRHSDCVDDIQCKIFKSSMLCSGKGLAMHCGPRWCFFRNLLCCYLQTYFFYESLPDFCRLQEYLIRFVIGIALLLEVSISRSASNC